MNFASKSVIHENSLVSFTCSKTGTWDIFFCFPSEGRHTEDFLGAREIQQLRPGLKPRTRVPVASMLTARPPKPSSVGLYKLLDGKKKLICYSYLQYRPNIAGGRDSSVGIATAYGLDGQGIESRWGLDFPHRSKPALRPTQLPVQWVPGLSRG